MFSSLLFAGLLMNYDRVPDGLKWMQTLSFFHAGYEALLVNELRYLQLIERKFGLDIQVPSATSEPPGQMWTRSADLRSPLVVRVPCASLLVARYLSLSHRVRDFPRR